MVGLINAVSNLGKAEPRPFSGFVPRRPVPGDGSKTPSMDLVAKAAVTVKAPFNTVRRLRRASTTSPKVGAADGLIGISSEAS
ncbi:MAG: hypothetical protein R3F37_19965 [Candidatus Competibacteraceae bacterium]